MIVKSGPHPKPEAPSRPLEPAPLPSAPPRSVAPWRAAAVAGLLVLAFFVRPLGWGAVLVLAWIAASEFVALVHARLEPGRPRGRAAGGALMGRSEFTLSRERYKYIEDAMERHDAATRPAPRLPIPCTYCGGPIGADENECPECRAKAVRCQRCGGGHLACLPVETVVLTVIDPPIVGVPIVDLAERKP